MWAEGKIRSVTKQSFQDRPYTYAVMDSAGFFKPIGLRRAKAHKYETCCRTALNGVTRNSEHYDRTETGSPPWQRPSGYAFIKSVVSHAVYFRGLAELPYKLYAGKSEFSRIRLTTRKRHKFCNCGIACANAEFMACVLEMEIYRHRRNSKFDGNLLGAPALNI